MMYYWRLEHKDGSEWIKSEMEQLIAGDFMGRSLPRSHEWSFTVITTKNQPVLIDTFGDMHYFESNDDMIVRYYHG